MPNEESVRSRDFERFLTFVDAVVAIAITLLVLPLVDVASGVTSHSDVGEVLSDHGAQFLAFAISFLVISRLWFAQHHVLRPVVAASPSVSFLLMLWLATIVVLPFSTALIAQVGHSVVAQILYIGGMALGSAFLAGVSILVARDHSLRDGPAVDPATTVVVTVIFLVALALTLSVPDLSFYTLLLLYAGGPLARWWRRWRGPLPD
jgi:uncharacterized membrane protein